MSMASRRKIKKFDWVQVQEAKSESWVCAAPDDIVATIVKKNDEFVWAVKKKENQIASGWGRSLAVATGNAELRMRSALNEDLG